MITLLFTLQLAVWQSVHPPVLHAGYWESCAGEERALEHAVNGQVRWILHLGPDDEFALYRGTGPSGEHDHIDRANLLGPAYRIAGLSTFRGARQWRIPALRLWLSITRAGGSRPECQSFHIRIEESIK